MSSTLRILSMLALFGAVTACGEEAADDVAPAEPEGPEVEAPETPEAPEPETPEVPEPETPDPEMVDPEEPGPEDIVGVRGRCLYANPFSGAEECKAYTGGGWTVEAAETDCTESVMGAPGRFVADLDCGFAAELGRCTVGDNSGDGYVLVFAGDDPASCQGSVLGCETFAGGTFTPAGVCADGAPPSGVPSDEAFIFGEKICAPSPDGSPGQGPDGTVCTWDGIQGCTEEGRRFIDQASCETSWRQRGYYPIEVSANTAPDDPRLEDDDYMAEARWLTAQVESCSCSCCHSMEATPRGPSMWFVEDGPLWFDSVSDEGLAMFAGFAESEAFGAYPAEDNNGFDRTRTGLPTTDTERLQRFLRAELNRRGVAEPEAEEWVPFGGPLVTQADFVPSACEDGEGVAADGTVSWVGGGARYVYVLAAGSANPGTPPNLFQPDGTLWHLMVDPTDDPIQAGFEYGTTPDGAMQLLPAGDGAPALVPGERYYMYVLADIIRPVTRCEFVYGI